MKRLMLVCVMIVVLMLTFISGNCEDIFYPQMIDSAKDSVLVSGFQGSNIYINKYRMLLTGFPVQEIHLRTEESEKCIYSTIHTITDIIVADQTLYVHIRNWLTNKGEIVTVSIQTQENYPVKLWERANVVSLICAIPDKLFFEAMTGFGREGTGIYILENGQISLYTDNVFDIEMSSDGFSYEKEGRKYYVNLNSGNEIFD